MRTVGIQFQQPSKVHYFNAGKFELKRGDQVVVKTDRGLTLGRVALTPEMVRDENQKSRKLPMVVRLAKKTDFDQLNRNVTKEINAFSICQKKIREMKLPMKLVKADFTLGGGKVTFYFYAEKRVDFRRLLQNLNSSLGIKIEMIQIGVRNVAGMIGGIGICGRELCCSTFLTDFKPISIKMAKVQNLSLNPEKVSGCCGRLLCCLQYEFDLYKTMSKKLPKIGKKVRTTKGDGKVRSTDILKQLVFVELHDDQTTVCLRPEDIIRDDKRPETPTAQ